MKHVLFFLCILLSFKSALAQGPIFDQQETSKSNVQMYITNTGIFGLNIRANNWGAFWPRGSSNYYMSGSGIWFGAKKRVSGVEQKLVTISCDLDARISWMTPGLHGDDLKITDWHKYKLYNSLKYNSDGTPNDTSKFNWPLWNTQGNLKNNRNFGSYIYSTFDRSSTVFKKGAAFVSDEDIISVFNDGDLKKYYRMTPGEAHEKGYPLGLQFEQALYSWNTGTPLQDVIALRYKIINTSQDTLKECWFGPAVDAEVTHVYNVAVPNSNDRVRYFLERPDLNTGIAWNDDNAGNNGDGKRGLGVLAVSLLETPATDKNGNLRKDKKSYNFTEQLGLKTLKNWGIYDALHSDTARYAALSNGILDGDDRADLKRMLLATGPFHMLPGDTTYLTVAFTFAKRDMANENYAELIQKIEAIRDTLFKNAGEEIPEANPENPFVIYNSPSEVTLYLSLLKTENVKIEIFNVLGQRMSEVFKGELSAQNHAIPFSTALFPSGAYYCAIVTDSGVEMVPVRIAR